VHTYYSYNTVFIFIIDFNLRMNFDARKRLVINSSIALQWHDKEAMATLVNP